MGLQDRLEQEDALRGVADLNGAIAVENLTGLWNLTPGDPFTDLQNFNTTDRWDEVSGGTVSLQSGLNVLETDGTQASSRAILETAPLGIYRAGTQVRVAGGFTTAADPTEDQYYEWGYGRADGDSHIFYRDTADDLQIRTGNERSGEKVVSRAAGDLNPGNVTEKTDGSGNTVLRVYGLDAMDGDGPSGIDYDRSKGYVSGFRIGWYGPTVTIPFLVGVGDIAGSWRERVFPLCILKPVGEPLITRPNEPWKFEVNNNGSAPESGGLRLPTGGRQFSYGGNIMAGREDTVHQSPTMTVPMDGTGTTVELKESGGPTREWYVLGVFKRTAGDEETAVSLGEMSFTNTENLRIHARVIPESDLSGTLDYSEPSDVHGESSYVEVDMWEDTPSRITIDSATIDGRTRLKGKSWGGSIVSGSGQNNRFTVGSANDYGLQFVRNEPVVLLGNTVSGSSSTASGNIGFPGVQ